MILYEYPLNERIRTLLRLEDLYERARHYLQGTGAYDHHTCLMAIFDILEVASRADLKSDLLQELERQKSYLLSLRDNPAVAAERLTSVVRSIEGAFTALLATAGKTGQELRDNEWLMSIKQRAAIPGGVCEFDAPSYHYWMHRPPEERQLDLEAWLRPLWPVYEGLAVVLRVLREAARTQELRAVQGVYSQSPMERQALLLRVRLSAEERCIPEISANKYALNIRFLLPDGIQKSRVAERDIPFELSFCYL